LLALVQAAADGLDITADQLRVKLLESGDLPDVESGALDEASLRMVAEVLDLMRGRDQTREPVRLDVRCRDCEHYR
jgi:hypothetical protein